VAQFLSAGTFERWNQENDLKLQIGIDGKTYEVEVEIMEDDAAPKPHYIPPRQTATVVTSTTAPAAGAPRASTPGQELVNEGKVCRSPIAGMVTRVNVQPGQEIQPNDLLLVLEAMKMETNVVSPVAGKVKKVTVEQGDGVQLNQVLVEFE
jgi:methylmalonyl-CoA carboxyltransferase small subunit